MALKYMRDNLKNLKWVLWFVVIVFVALVFVDWGSGRAGGMERDVALQVGDLTVTEQEFLQQLRDSERQYRTLFGEQWEQLRGQVNLAEQTVQRLIQRELLAREAEEIGLVVSEQELREQIVDFPAFQREDGSFVGSETYARILAANQTTPHEFERSLRQDLLIQKLRQMVESGVYVSRAEVREAVRRERERASFDAVPVRYEAFLADVDVDEEQIAAYYQEHREDFERNEQRVVRYLAVETSRLRRSLPVEDAELEAYYEQHGDEFQEGEKAHARHILFRVPAGAPDEVRAEAKLRADAVTQMAKQGAEFDALARQHSEDPASREVGGDLGWFERGRMVPEFETAVFGAKPGEVVGPVESQFGYHVIKVEGFQPARRRPFEEVREQVRYRVLEGRAAAEAEARSAALLRRVRAEKPATEEAWQAIADEDDAVTLNVSPPFERGAVIPGIGQDPELEEELFAADELEVGGPEATARGWVVWQLAEIRPEGVAPLEDVREAVTERVRRRAALEAARARAEQAAASWRSGVPAESVAADLGSTLVPVTEHQRGAAVPGLGAAGALDEAVFTAAIDDIVGPVPMGERGFVVARVNDLQVVSEGEMEVDMARTRARLVAERVDQLLTAILNERRREVAVTVNPELVERFAPSGANS